MTTEDTKVRVGHRVIYEFIERETKGFCEENAKDLMMSIDDD